MITIHTLNRRDYEKKQMLFRGLNVNLLGNAETVRFKPNSDQISLFHFGQLLTSVQ